MTDSKVFEGVDFRQLEEQRLALSFILAAASKDIRSQHVEMSIEELEGLQNFLDHVTDVACEIYGEETVLPLMTQVNREMDQDVITIERGLDNNLGKLLNFVVNEKEGAKIIQHPASVGKTNKQ